MSDEPIELNPTKQWAHHIAASESRARTYLLTAPRCEACGNPMAVRGRTRHFLCDPTEFVGRSCSCRPDCSNKRYGDGPTACDPQCQVCRIQAGQPVPGGRKKS